MFSVRGVKDYPTPFLSYAIILVASRLDEISTLTLLSSLFVNHGLSQPHRLCPTREEPLIRLSL